MSLHRGLHHGPRDPTRLFDPDVLRTAQNRVTDRATRAHVGHLLARIDEVLNPGD